MNLRCWWRYWNNSDTFDSDVFIWQWCIWKCCDVIKHWRICLTVTPFNDSDTLDYESQMMQTLFEQQQRIWQWRLNMTVTHLTVTHLTVTHLFDSDTFQWQWRIRLWISDAGDAIGTTVTHLTVTPLNDSDAFESVVTLLNIDVFVWQWHIYMTH